MKILAIRGAGLASLSEPFEVSLDQGALAHAGVFAIVGPTGAGKSTLLDALFLALFGDTPRLTNQQRVRLPGRRSDGEKAEPLTTRDARGLARGDVALAFAEVDFLGIDGKRYRARWEVRRKRGGGAFKKPEHALTALGPSTESQRLGGTKTEVLGHVIARLGLDFDQFRRSVVLAQGEIAAFLHAPDRDRAELLERITGTEIYGEISREIHLEAVRQRERAGLLQTQLAASSVMDATARRAAEHAVSTAHLNALQAEQARQTDEVEVERHQRTLELARERDEATAHVTALDAALTERASDVQQVRSMRVLEGLLPILRAVARADEEVLARGEACRTAEAAVTETNAHEPAARSDHEAAAQAHRAADAELARVTSSLSKAERALAAAQVIEGRAKDTIAHGAALSQQRAHADADRADAASEQQAAEHAIASWQAQRTRWPALDGVLARAIEPDDTLARAERIERERTALDAVAAGALARGATQRAASERAEQNVLDARERLEAGSARAGRAERQLAEALLQLEGASYAPQKRAPSPARAASDARAYVRPSASGPLMARQPAVASSAGGLDTIESQRAPILVAMTDRPALDTLMKRCTEARRTAHEVQGQLSTAIHQLEVLAQAHHRRRTEQARTRIERARFADELGRLQRELLEATSIAERADHDLESALRAGHAAELRAHLVAGQPCEVCGASDHPRLRSASDPSTAPVEGVSDADALRLLRDEARGSRELLSSRHFALRSAFELTFTSSLAEADDAGSARTHAAEAAQLRAQQGELDLALTALDDAEREARDAQSRVRDEQAASADARESAARAKNELRASEQEAHERASKAQGLAEEAASLGLEILAASAASTGQSTQAFLRDAFTSRSAAKHASARVDLLAARHTRAVDQLAAIEAQIAAHRAPMERAREACEQAATVEGVTRDARRARERSAADLERTNAALTTANEGLALVLRAIERATTERTRAETALRDATDRASLAARDLDEQVNRALPHWAALDQGTAASHSEGTPPDADAMTRMRDGVLEQARALSRYAPDVLAERARTIEAMLKSRDLAVAVSMERTRRLEAHAASAEHPRIECLDRSAIEARIEALSIALEARRRSEVALRSELSRCEHLIERDDVAKAARADKASAVSAAQEQLAVWEDLLDALGSADGKKLRVHAQRLTLRALVREASLHLEAIAPRYAIEVVEGGDLAIQVSDRALGGEVRALGALSGGETFLVSLALALALRGLTSEQVRIASLFIDEGFGSLDAQSLDIVLSALDALEATGRQVGIVSHVPEVKERFAARIEVVPQGGGKSVVRVTA